MKLESKVKAVKQEKSYGTLYLSSKDIPSGADAVIGDVLELTISLKVTQLRAPDQWDISEKKMGPKDVLVSGNITKISEKSVK